MLPALPAALMSDHSPLLLQGELDHTPKNYFRFENFWVEHDGFFDLVHNSWYSLHDSSNSARNISKKFKKLRGDLKIWSKSLSNLSLLIDNCNEVIGFLDALEDRRVFSILKQI